MNTAAVSVIRDAYELDEPGSSSQISFLSAEEELLLVKLYISKIPQLCHMFRFPETVEATAISFLKRFYLKNTVMDWHPKNVMLTALFLATKTTNNPISLEYYVSVIPRTAPSDVLDLEFLVSQSLNFEFSVWHAYTAFWGLWLDLQSMPDSPESPEQAIYIAAVEQINSSRLTDAEFIYTPAQIALACLSLVSRHYASRWCRYKLQDQEASLMEDIVERIQALIIDHGHVPPVEAVREVDRRLRLCKNPEKVVGSRAYLARQAEKEQKAAARRQRKAQLTEDSMKDGDPFGNSMRDDDDDDDDD